MIARGLPRAAHVLVLLVLGAAMLFPFYWLGLTSLRPDRLMFQVPASFSLEGLTLANYAHALANPNILSWFINSTVVAIIVLIFVVSLGALGGYGFSRFRFKGSRFLVLVILASQMFPGILLALPVFRLSAELGLLDTWTALVLVQVGTQLPAGVWLFRSFFASIPKELDEAALVDGCTPVTAFLRIVLPLTAPGIAAVGMFSFVRSWNEYLLPLILLTSPDKWTYPLGLASFIGYEGTDYGGILASSVLATLPMVAVYLIFQRQLVAGLTSGSIKG